MQVSNPARVHHFNLMEIAEKVEKLLEDVKRMESEIPEMKKEIKRLQEQNEKLTENLHRFAPGDRVVGDYKN